MKSSGSRLTVKSDRLDLEFRALLSEGLTSCLSVAVAIDQEVVYEFVEGVSRKKAPRSTITKATRFNIGSVTKPITASLIVKLMEMGKLRFDDPVSKFIAGFKNEQVQVRHLMMHTAGYSNIQLSWPQKAELPSYMREIYKNSPTYPAGERCDYYTYGYSILMDIIERVSGMSIEDFSQHHLFHPLAMLDTTYNTTRLVPGQYTLPYLPDQSDWDEQLDHLAATGDSGLYSTAADLIKFGSMLLGEGIAAGGAQIFERTSVQFMLKEATDGHFQKTPIFWRKGEEDRYGCFGDHNSASALAHPGFSGCLLLVDPHYKATVAVLTNSQKWHANWENYKMVCNLIFTEEAST